jgi:hypothetical protein
MIIIHDADSRIFLPSVADGSDHLNHTYASKFKNPWTLLQQLMGREKHGVPKNSWMVYFYKWMITRGTPVPGNLQIALSENSVNQNLSIHWIFIFPFFGISFWGVYPIFRLGQIFPRNFVFGTGLSILFCTCKYRE